MWGIILVVSGYMLARVSDFVAEKYPKIQRLHRSIQEYNPGFLDSWKKTLKTVMKMQYDSIIQTIKSAKLDPTHYEVDYYHNNRQYRIKFKKNLQNSLLIWVYDEHENDITEKFLQYLGPHFDFHGINYCPHDFGYKKITVLNQDYNSLEFSEFQTINFTSSTPPPLSESTSSP